jgi:hypothetical protein
LRSRWVSRSKMPGDEAEREADAAAVLRRQVHRATSP